MALIGVDAGGSHTTAVVTNEDLSPIARLDVGPGAVTPAGIEQAAAVIADAMARVTAKAGGVQIGSAVVGAAGTGRETERKALESALATRMEGTRIRVVTDGEVALHAAHRDAPGIVIIAGTGSVGFARDASGDTHRVGGYGPAFEDEVGGYTLSRTALAAIGRAHDGRGPATALTEAAFAAVHVASFDELVRWAAQADYQHMAALAPIVLAAAKSGDPCARGIVSRAAATLCDLAERLLVRCRQTSMPLAMSGGLLGKESSLRMAFVATLSGRLPNVRLNPTTVDPAMGAASLAARLQSPPA